MLVCRVYSVGDFVSVGCTVWTILSWARFVGLYVSLLNIQYGYGYLGQDLWDCELVSGVYSVAIFVHVHIVFGLP